VDATTYTFDITPTAEGDVTVDIAAGGATDLAGNSNLAATQLTRIYDITPPTVTLTTDAADTVNAAFTVTATFSEDVTDFNASDITVANGTVGNFEVVNATTYTFEVTPTDDGEVTVDIEADVATDLAGNPNIPATTQLTRTADITPPTVTLTTDAADTVNAAFTVTATFSEDVTDFNASDITVANGTVGNFEVVNATTYTFEVTPTDDGEVTVDIEADVATDLAGNPNIPATTQLTRTADITPPTVTLTTDAADTVNAAFTVTATFSEDVTDFNASDITVANGTVGNFEVVNATTYTFEVTPTNEGDVTVDIAAGGATDLAGNSNLAATQLTRIYDITPPTVTLTTDAADTVNAAFTVTATFSEDVTDFNASDITVANGTVGNFEVVNATTYTFEVTPTNEGDVTVDIAAGGADDLAGNSNIAAPQLTRIYDITAPDAPTITSTGVTNNPTPDITGEAEAGSTVEVFKGGTSLGTTIADGD
ncbi:Ig-like domain-containing protein, partial [Arthrospira platensis SPKY1]|nr:Ig-like domain-containing protein [Arthrospira platensis SPKY1]